MSKYKEILALLEESTLTIREIARQCRVREFVIKKIYRQRSQNKPYRQLYLSDLNK